MKEAKARQRVDIMQGDNLLCVWTELRVISCWVHYGNALMQSLDDETAHMQKGDRVYTYAAVCSVVRVTDYVITLITLFTFSILTPFVYDK